MKIHLHIKHALCAIAISLLSLASTSAQTAASLIEQGTKLLTESYSIRENNDYFISEKYKEGLQLLRQACELDKSSSEAKFELGKAYIQVQYRDLSLANVKKGYKLIHEAANMGNIYAAIYLFNRPESHDDNESHSFNEKIRLKYNNQRSTYANKLLDMPLPADFNDYLSLAKAARWTRNISLSSKYASIAIDNGEYGASDFIIQSGKIYPNFFDSISPKAQFDIAEKLPNNGIQLIKKSAEAGYAEAQFWIGFYYSIGIFVEQDTVQAVKWFRLGADNDSPKALCHMGELYANGLQGVPQDSVKAFESFKRSYELGHEDSARKLALCYLNGFGTEPNQAKARELLEQFRSKYSNLYYFVALTYYNELSPKAVELFEQCVKDSKLPDSQRSDALRKLSACYRFGRCGVTTDPDKADALLKEAATYGDQEATDVLQFLNLQ